MIPLYAITNHKELWSVSVSVRLFQPKATKAASLAGNPSAWVAAYHALTPRSNSVACHFTLLCAAACCRQLPPVAPCCGLLQTAAPHRGLLLLIIIIIIIIII